jgi:hypothetical protein
MTSGSTPISAANDAAYHLARVLKAQSADMKRRRRDEGLYDEQLRVQRFIKALAALDDNQRRFTWKYVLPRFNPHGPVAMAKDDPPPSEVPYNQQPGVQRFIKALAKLVYDQRLFAWKYVLPRFSPCGPDVVAGYLTDTSAERMRWLRAARPDYLGKEAAYSRDYRKSDEVRERNRLRMQTKRLNDPDYYQREVEKQRARNRARDRRR